MVNHCPWTECAIAAVAADTAAGPGDGRLGAMPVANDAALIGRVDSDA